MPQRIARIGAFIHKHRAKLAVAATSAAFIALMASRAKEWNAFLAEHNLTDEFYGTGE